MSFLCCLSCKKSTQTSSRAFILILEYGWNILSCSNILFESSATCTIPKRFLYCLWTHNSLYCTSWLIQLCLVPKPRLQPPQSIDSVLREDTTYFNFVLLLAEADIDVPATQGEASKAVTKMKVRTRFRHNFGIPFFVDIMLHAVFLVSSKELHFILEQSRDFDFCFDPRRLHHLVAEEPNKSWRCQRDATYSMNIGSEHLKCFSVLIIGFIKYLCGKKHSCRNKFVLCSGAA